MLEKCYIMWFLDCDSWLTLEDSFSYDDDNRVLVDHYACSEEQLQVYRDNAYFITHAHGPCGMADRERFVKTPEMQARDGCTTHCSVCHRKGNLSAPTR